MWYWKRIHWWILTRTTNQIIVRICSQSENDFFTTFRSNFRHEPSLDENNYRAIQLQQQLRHYYDQDPSTSQQKCLPLCIFQQLWRNAFTSRDRAIGELATGALFFGMRSCEYLKVEGDRKTKWSKERDEQINRIKQLSHGIMREHYISKSKERRRDETITMHKNNKELCPVPSWGRIIIRIESYPGSNANLPINTFLVGKTLRLITSKEVISHIRSTVQVIGENIIGVKTKEIRRYNTHSIRSSFSIF